MEARDFIQFLQERFQMERKKFDGSGVYGHTQRLLAYNSNKVEGNTLTEEQTASLFDNDTLSKLDDYYRVKDVEEMNGHFLMFNKMLDIIEEPLTQELIKMFHCELKSGVFEDRANRYAIGDYGWRPNMIGIYQAVRPELVETEIQELLNWCHKQRIHITVLAEFHVRYGSIRPFQDGNDGVGRLMLFRECLRNGIPPVVIEDSNRSEYLEALKKYKESSILDKMVELFGEEQEYYYKETSYFIQWKTVRQSVILIDWDHSSWYF